jgi:Arc/MetJ-type ribon-helix-helix transcriptional regulator
LRYDLGMSVQITVRIPDPLAEFMDGVVQRGEAGSRAEVVARALLAAWRRQRDEADLEVIKRFGADLYPDLAGIHEGAAASGSDDLVDLD